MSQWSSVKAKRVCAALLNIGWTIKRESGGSHRVLAREGLRGLRAGLDSRLRMIAR